MKMKMKHSLVIILVLNLLLCLLGCSHSFPLCTDMKAPFKINAPLAFCQYSGSVCCNSTQDVQLQNQYKAMNISDTGCASIVKSILCSKCDPFAANLYRTESMPRAVPVLCNSSVPDNSPQFQVNVTDYCTKVWDKCQNVSIQNSPFALQSKANSSSKISSIYNTRETFCNEFGDDSVDGLFCYAGRPVVLNSSGDSTTPSGICLEKIGNGSYLNMASHPDGSNRVFLSEQSGKIWLATIPEQGSGKTLEVGGSNPFLDITDIVHFDTQFGLMGMAVHPNYLDNGRFFVSFNCDKTEWQECSGRCSCNSDVNCDPSKLSPDNGAQPCQYHSIIAEFTAGGTGLPISSVKNFGQIANATGKHQRGTDKSLNSQNVTSISPMEVRRIFTMGLPFSSHHGGQILFGPKDKYMYFMMGDGGNIGDPYNFSQKKKSPLGKVMRLDVDNIPSASTINELSLWGNYSVPNDNPFLEDTELLPEVWALGFRNPWRCSFDSERPSYFLCADVGQDLYEEVDIVTKGGNYGWRVYEGPYLYNASQSPGGNTSASSINPIFPVMGYNHSVVKNGAGSASITGGYFYRSVTDPCLNGRYIYADLYGGGIWVGTETPENSGSFTTSQVQFSCTEDSPIKCSDGTSTPDLGVIFSFGQDNSKDIFILASNGLFRIVSPSHCSYTCSKENVTSHAPPGPASPPSNSLGVRLRYLSSSLLLLLNLVSSAIVLLRFVR